MNYSVLMSVYNREKSENLKESMDSIYRQTIPTNDFVLVCDGPLGSDLNKVIEEMKNKFQEKLKVLRLPENVGLGNALNEGIKHCKNELVARMDSDDIAYLNRCERQLEIFKKHSEISICSATVEEFSDTIDKIEAKRIVPETSEEIKKFAQKRNPFNHPCVMYKKTAVEDVGSYKDFYLLEDYYLWIRMLINGYQGYNIQEPLLYMRAGSDMYKRRSGYKYAKSQKKLLMYMKKQRFININQYIKSVIVRTGSAMLPNDFRKFLYKKIMREEI